MPRAPDRSAASRKSSKGASSTNTRRAQPPSPGQAAQAAPARGHAPSYPTSGSASVTVTATRPPPVAALDAALAADVAMTDGVEDYDAMALAARSSPDAHADSVDYLLNDDAFMGQ